jgi:hypothetical protein
MTASHGPARVEERCASQSPFGTAGPYDDRGRRRDRGTSFAVLRFAEEVKKGADDFRTSLSTVTSVAGPVPQPLADALGIFQT